MECIFLEWKERKLIYSATFGKLFYMAGKFKHLFCHYNTTLWNYVLQGASSPTDLRGLAPGRWNFQKADAKIEQVTDCRPKKHKSPDIGLNSEGTQTCRGNNSPFILAAIMAIRYLSRLLLNISLHQVRTHLRGMGARKRRNVDVAWFPINCSDNAYWPSGQASSPVLGFSLQVSLTGVSYLHTCGLNVCVSVTSMVRLSETTDLCMQTI